MNADEQRQAQRGTRCASHLHDWPLPRGYTAAADEADDRLAAGWLNPRCPRCQAFGWLAPS
jgi:hypothetical protein